MKKMEITDYDSDGSLSSGHSSRKLTFFDNSREVSGSSANLNIMKCNEGKYEKPAELFRKDLISAMKLPDTELLFPEDYILILDPWRQEWERGVQVPVNSHPLHVSNAIKIEENESIYGAYGFKLPKKLLHATSDDQYKPALHELHETQKLAEEMCRYDLDDVDITWLRIYNELKSDFGQAEITDWQMERMIEELETRCYSALKAAEAMGMEYDEDTVCDVCKMPDVEEGNEMVFCDGCDVGVHQVCYGILKIPKGSWVCRACAIGFKPRCALCMTQGGAMKSTKDGSQWAHLSCAIWVPEVTIACPDKMEPIDNIDDIPMTRWNLVCCICKERSGACIQCSVKKCKTSFHVTCAYKKNYEMKLNFDDCGKDLQLKAFCDVHSKKKDSTPSKKKHSKDGSSCGGGSGNDTGRNRGGNDNDDCGDDNDYEEGVKVSKKDGTVCEDGGGVDGEGGKDVGMDGVEEPSGKTRRTHKITDDFYKYVNIREVSNAVGVNMESTTFVYEYWKLKRKSNFNKALLTPKMEEGDILLKQRQESLLARLRMFIHLRQDLERVRNLCYMVTKRERTRVQLYQVKRDLFQQQVESLDENIKCQRLFVDDDKIYDYLKDLSSNYNVISQAHKIDQSVYDRPHEIETKARVYESVLAREPANDSDDDDEFKYNFYYLNDQNTTPHNSVNNSVYNINNNNKNINNNSKKLVSTLTINDLLKCQNSKSCKKSKSSTVIKQSKKVLSPPASSLSSSSILSSPPLSSPLSVMSTTTQSTPKSSSLTIAATPSTKKINKSEKRLWEHLENPYAKSYNNFSWLISSRKKRKLEQQEDSNIVTKEESGECKESKAKENLYKYNEMDQFQKDKMENQFNNLMAPSVILDERVIEVVKDCDTNSTVGGGDMSTDKIVLPDDDVKLNKSNFGDKTDADVSFSSSELGSKSGPIDSPNGKNYFPLFNKSNLHKKSIPVSSVSSSLSASFIPLCASPKNVTKKVICKSKSSLSELSSRKGIKRSAKIRELLENSSTSAEKCSTPCTTPSTFINGKGIVRNEGSSDLSDFEVENKTSQKISTADDKLVIQKYENISKNCLPTKGVCIDITRLPITSSAKLLPNKQNLSKITQPNISHQSSFQHFTLPPSENLLDHSPSSKSNRLLENHCSNVNRKNENIVKDNVDNCNTIDKNVKKNSNNSSKKSNSSCSIIEMSNTSKLKSATKIPFKEKLKDHKNIISKSFHKVVETDGCDKKDGKSVEDADSALSRTNENNDEIKEQKLGVDDSVSKDMITSTVDVLDTKRSFCPGSLEKFQKNLNKFRENSFTNHKTKNSQVMKNLQITIDKYLKKNRTKCDGEVAAVCENGKKAETTNDATDSAYNSLKVDNKGERPKSLTISTLSLISSSSPSLTSSPPLSLVRNKTILKTIVDDNDIVKINSLEGKRNTRQLDKLKNNNLINNELRNKDSNINHNSTKTNSKIENCKSLNVNINNHLHEKL